MNRDSFNNIICVCSHFEAKIIGKSELNKLKITLFYIIKYLFGHNSTNYVFKAKTTLQQNLFITKKPLIINYSSSRILFLSFEITVVISGSMPKYSAM